MNEMNIRRRDTLCFALSLCSAPLRAQGRQAGKLYRIAWISGTSIAPSPQWTAFAEGMRELGWIEGQNFTVENLLYEGRSERLPAVAAEAVQRKFDLIICAGTKRRCLPRSMTSSTA